MPLLKVRDQLARNQTDADAPFVAAIAGQAAGPLHTGGFVAGTVWGILAAVFPQDPCNSEGPGGCSQAMALRALHLVFREVPGGKDFILYTDTLEVAALIIDWQRGNTALPSWYKNDSAASTVARVQRNIVRLTGQMRVIYLPAVAPAAEAARLLSYVGLRHLRDQLTPEEMHAEGQRIMQETL